MYKKLAIITGVSGEIGQEISKVLSLHHWKIFGLDIKEPKDHIDEFYNIDLRKLLYSNEQETLTNLLKGFENKYTIKALINNAAIQNIKKFEDLEIEELMSSMAVNLYAPFVLSKILSPFLEKNSGNIINIGSIHSYQSKKGFMSYSVSKSALNGLTRALALELGEKIIINSVEPAAIDTEMLHSGFENSEVSINKLKKLHPVGDIGYPNDIAKIIKFLLCDAPKFIHGSTIAVDGGIRYQLMDIQKEN